MGDINDITNCSIESLVERERVYLNGIKNIKLFKKEQHIGYSDSPYPFTAKVESNIAPNIGSTISKWKFPLNFISVQVNRTGAASDKIDLFAVSCCTVGQGVNSNTVETWIATENETQNLSFLTALLKYIEDNGTTLVWSSDFTDFLINLKKSHDYSNCSEFLRLERLLTDSVDLNAVILDFYFHKDLPGKSNFQKNLDSLEQKNKRRYSLNDLFDNVLVAIEDPDSIGLAERSLSAGFVFDFNHSQLPLELHASVDDAIDPFWERFRFGKVEGREALSEKLREYSQLKTMQMVEWYKCWLLDK